MNKLYFFVMLLLYSSLVNAKDFYVGPQGNDKNEGTKTQPFKSISHARDIVRQWKKLHPDENIYIWLYGGNYTLPETLVFGIEDGSGNGQTITYAAFKEEKPIINSDVFLSGWKKASVSLKGLPAVAKGKIWYTNMPAGINDFRTLYSPCKMLPRSKTTAIANPRKSEDWVGADSIHRTVPFLRENIDSIFNPKNAELLVVPAAPWTMNRLAVKYTDAAKGLIYLGAPSTYALAQPRFYMGPECLWIENTFAGMNIPGNWVCDKDAGLIYYWPENGGDPNNDSLSVPRLTELIRVEGKIDYKGLTDTPVQGLIFRGLTFNHGDRFESAGQTGLGLQHDWEKFDSPTALVRFRGADHCVIDRCNFSESGGAGVRLDLYAQHVSIMNSDFFELGGCGILLAGYGPGTKDVNKNNDIANNSIHHIGRLWWHSIGIWAWQSGQNNISHNTIHNVPYTAIAVTGRINWDKSGKAECSKTVRWNETEGMSGGESWEERERFLHGRQNIIEHNDISDVMEIMQDGNGVYISGAGRGNIIRRNFLHNTPSKSAGEAIRCDDDQNETLIESNVVFNYGSHGIGICCKGRNYIFNNIVACPPDRVNRGMLSFEPTSDKSCAGAMALHNIFYADLPNQPFVYEEGIFRVMATLQTDRNIYFNACNNQSADSYLKKARESGQEINSMQADPLFRDAKKGDFRLDEHSPVFKLGFRPFELEAGCVRN